MVLLHRHHIIPRHMGGSNDVNNLELVTIPEHAQRHLQLWIAFGQEQDEIAWLTLSGQIDKEEATLRAIRLGGLKRRGVPKTIEHRAKISSAKKGKPGPKLSQEHIENIADKLRGVSKSSEHANNISRGKTGFKSINNGVVARMIRIEEIVPEGWKLGAMPRPSRQGKPHNGMKPGMTNSGTFKKGDGRKRNAL